MKTRPEVKTAFELFLDRNQFDLNPPYQRDGGVWSLDKKQLFLDSVVNRFDIPKIYIHELSLDERESSASGHSFAVIDGKQRLSALWDFFQDGFPLADGFKSNLDASDLGLEESDLPKAGQTFSDFSERLTERVKSYSISTVFISECDEEDIDEQFSRLNNGEPLNASEKRNAFGGTMAKIIREVSENDFFKKKLKVKNKRFVHLEIATKLVRLQQSDILDKDDVVDLNKKHLDNLVLNNKEYSDPDRDRLLKEINKSLKTMSKVFDNEDALLGKQSVPQIYFVFINRVFNNYASIGERDLPSIVKNFLEKFEAERIKTSRQSEDEKNEDFVLFSLEAQQGTNSLSGMVTRLDLLERYFLKWNGSELSFKDAKRHFTPAERYYVWIKANKQCEKCEKSVAMNEMDADHIVPWSKGGETSIDNARCLCVSCNRSN